VRVFGSHKYDFNGRSIRFQTYRNTCVFLALRHVVAAWCNMNKTALYGGEYQRELTARER